MTTSKLWKDPLARHESDDSSNISFHPAGKSKLSENQIQQLDAVGAGTPAMAGMKRNRIFRGFPVLFRI